jgi:hypothetical protein
MTELESADSLLVLVTEPVEVEWSPVAERAADEALAPSALLVALRWRRNRPRVVKSVEPKFFRAARRGPGQRRALARKPPNHDKMQLHELLAQSGYRRIPLQRSGVGHFHAPREYLETLEAQMFKALALDRAA